jgi:hypothetical protein
MDVIAKATAALETSVGLILDSDGSEEEKRQELVETFTQFQTYLDRNVGDDIVKARRDHRAGHHGLAAAVVEHTIDRLSDLRRRHGFEKAQPEKEQPAMTSLENIAKTHGVAGVVEIAKNITEAEKSYSITEEQFCKLIDTAARAAHPELGALAFERVYTHNPVLAKAISVIKAALFTVELGPGMTPQVVTGADARDVDDPQAALDALHELARKSYPNLRPDIAFAKVFEDPANAALAQKAHRRPQPTTHYPHPR